MAALKESGTRFGRRSWLPEEVQEQVEAMHLSGLSLAEIARRMTASGIPTADGCQKWWPATVQSLLRSRQNDRKAGILPAACAEVTR